MTGTAAHIFEQLPIPRRELAVSGNRYRVYKDAKDFMLVEALNALEAFKSSGLPQAYRIERDGIYLQNVLDLKTLAPLAAAPADAAVPVAEAAAAPAAELSGDDVNKLLDAPATAAP
ncbi:MAG: hypothetical protein KGJ06_01880 [Pseudomonadota bacterium]|nr:hypothetical protein [Pseudomonadota bacterium]